MRLLLFFYFIYDYENGNCIFIVLIRPYPACAKTFHKRKGPFYSSSSNMNFVVHTRGLVSVSFSFRKTFLFLQLFAIQTHANFQVQLSLSLYCSNFDQKIFRSRFSSQFLLLNRFLTHSQVDRFGT